MGLVVSVPPTEESVSLTEAKAHFRLHVSVTDFDTDILSKIKTSEEWVREYLRVTLTTATYRLTLDRFPSCAFGMDRSLAERIFIPRPPLQEISQITYLDADGETQTVDETVYRVLTDCSPGVVVLNPDQQWPITYRTAGAVTVTYVAGYGDAENVPEIFKTGVKEFSRLLYEGLSIEEAAPSLKRLLSMYRVVDERTMRNAS